MPYVRREYIKGKPQSKIAKFSSGQASNSYDYKLELIVTENIQIRHNALEAARLSANKRMAQAGETSFFSKLKVYPHVLLRENKMIATAGADRLQEGMRRAFGKATGLAARCRSPCAGPVQRAGSGLGRGSGRRRCRTCRPGRRRSGPQRSSRPTS